MFRHGLVHPIAIGITLVAAIGTAHADKDPYRDAAGLNARLQELHDANPKTTRLVTITTTEHGGDVKSLEVDPDGRWDPDAPVLMLQGGVHGNEWISTEVVLRLAELATDGQPAWNGLTYRFIPAVNMDGFALGMRGAIDPDGVKYDTNREFPVPGEPDKPSRPLLQALRDYAKTGKVVAVLDFHSDAECMLWPWAYTRDARPAGHEVLADVSRDMALAVGHCHGQVSKIITYKHQGTAADWYQHALGASTILVELGNFEDPGKQTVEQVLIDQERPFRIFLGWLEHRGVKARPRPAIGAGCQQQTITVGKGPLGHRASGEVCDGQREGKWTYSFLTGEKMREGQYQRGLMQGPWRSYHRAGDIQDEGQYVDGKPDGTWIRHAPGGLTIEERSYVAGERDGRVLRWMDDGTLWQVRQCQKGPCRTLCKVTRDKVCVHPDDEVVAEPPPPKKRQPAARRSPSSKR